MGLKESGLRGSLRNVSVGIDAIPDDLTDRWIADEGDGEWLANDIGSIEIDLGFDRWVSGSQYAGGFAVDTESGDLFASDERLELTQSEFTVAFWTDGLNITGSNSGLVSCGDTQMPDPTSGDIVDGWSVLFPDGDGGTVSVAYINDTDFNVAIDESITVDAEQDHLMWAIVGDGDDVDLYLYDEEEQQDHLTGSASRGTQNDGYLVWNGSGDDWAEGPYDDLTAAQNVAVGELTVDDIHDSTGPNA